MRWGVLDTGSNSVHLLISDVVGGVPLPAHTVKARLRLAEHVDAEGRIGTPAVRRLAEAVGEAREAARRWECERLFAYATAVVRDAPNRPEVLGAVERETGLQLAVPPGELEAELTFLAARRWVGSQAGPMTLLDIGGGSLEVAFGRGARPDMAHSLPLGAGRLTREFLPGRGRPAPTAVRDLRRHVRTTLKDSATRVRWEEPRTAVATSRMFQQLARLCGAPPARHGPFAVRTLARPDLKRAIGQLTGLTAAQRAELPGISAARSRQAPAAAVVAHQAMKLMGIASVTICPWALREGVLLHHIEQGDYDGRPVAAPRQLPYGTGWYDLGRDAVNGSAPPPAVRRTAGPAPPGESHRKESV